MRKSKTIFIEVYRVSLDQYYIVGKSSFRQARKYMRYLECMYPFDCLFSYV